MMSLLKVPKRFIIVIAILSIQLVFVSCGSNNESTINIASKDDSSEDTDLSNDETNSDANEVPFIPENNNTPEWITQLGNSTPTPVSSDETSMHDKCLGVAHDDSGNVYCAGSTEGSLGEASGGGVDAFIMKLNADGSLAWIKQFGNSINTSGGDTSKDDSCNGVAVDSAGNVYCAGYTEGNIGETPGGVRDSFVVKLNSSGEVVWIKQLGVSYNVVTGGNAAQDTCNDVAVDKDGNVYCAGSVYGSFSENAGGQSDAFVMKLDSSGEVVWVKQFGNVTGSEIALLNENGGDTTFSDHCSSVAVDLNNNVICAGYTGGSLGESKGGSNDAFVIKLNASAEVVWVKQLGNSAINSSGNSADDRCNSVAVDSSGDVYCAGQTFGALADLNNGNNDAFILKLNSEDGSILWLKQLGSTNLASFGDSSSHDLCSDVAVDLAKNVYCAGMTYSSLGEQGGGGKDAFVVKLNSSGQIKWIHQLGAVTAPELTTIAENGGSSSFDDYYNAVSVDSSGNLYCAGETRGALGETNGGNIDSFIIKLK